MSPELNCVMIVTIKELSFNFYSLIVRSSLEKSSAVGEMAAQCCICDSNNEKMGWVSFQVHSCGHVLAEMTQNNGHYADPKPFKVTTFGTICDFLLVSNTNFT